MSVPAASSGVARRFQHGGTKRPQGGTLSRFVGTAAHADRAAAALPAGHAALREGRTLFPSRVFAADAVPRVLVGGHNAAKIGAVIAKGPWRGFPVVTLTLEERATCPRSCTLWRECYGNAMPLARRNAAGPGLVARLDAELRALAAAHPRGFAVRLHVLGDFHSMDYLAAWVRWMAALPALHVWGYTAHGSDTPIGRVVAEANEFWPDRWAVRFSGPAHVAGAMRATTIWRQPESAVVPEGLVCPAQTHATAACATCGLCWAPAMADRPIVFIGHGRNIRGGRAHAQAGAAQPRERAMEVTNPPPAGPGALTPEAIAAWLRQQVDAEVAKARQALRDEFFWAGWNGGWRAAMQRIVALAGEHAPVPPEVGDVALVPVPTMAASLATMARTEDQGSRHDSGGGTALPSIPQGPEGESAGIGAPESAAGGSGESGGAAADDAPSPPPAAQREAQQAPPAPAGFARWTPERRALLRELWSGDLSQGGIARQLSRLPGPDIAPAQLNAYARKQLGLGNRGEARAAARQHSEAPARAEPPPGPVHAPPAAAAPTVVLPAPAANGKIYATFTQIRDWAATRRLAYDGSNIDAVNKLRRMMGNAPPLVQAEA